MDIPKNTTQIGEVHGDYKIFIEDYVISYMKQLCRQEPDKKKRIAFYGVMRTEASQQYFFIYGGSEVKRYGRNDVYLSRQDYEEITWAGGSYFEEYVPLGFITLEEELPEGIYLFLAGKEIYVHGYHIFYEKNDSMLTFLIHQQNGREETSREESLTAESLQEKSPKEKSLRERELREKGLKEKDLQEKGLREERVRRKALPEEQSMEVSTGGRMEMKQRSDAPAGEMKLFGIVKSAAAALFIVLCVTAISTMNGLGKIEGLQNFFGQAFRTMTEKKLPDKAADTLAVSGEAVTVKDGTEESLINQMQQENNQEIKEQTPETEQISESSAELPGEDAAENLLESQPAETESPESEPSVSEQETSDVPDAEPEAESAAAEIRTHTIQKGETLISISKAYYGDDNHVQAICELNGIANSDNIQVGQKIILP